MGCRVRDLAWLSFGVAAMAWPTLSVAQMATPDFHPNFTITGPGASQNALTALNFLGNNPNQTFTDTETSSNARNFLKPQTVSTEDARRDYAFHGCVASLSHGNPMDVDEHTLQACRGMTTSHVAEAPVLHPILSDPNISDERKAALLRSLSGPPADPATAPPRPSDVDVSNAIAGCDASRNMMALLDDRCLDNIRVEVRDGKTALVISNAGVGGRDVTSSPLPPPPSVLARSEPVLPQHVLADGQRSAGLHVPDGLANLATPAVTALPAAPVAPVLTCSITPYRQPTTWYPLRSPAECVGRLKIAMTGAPSAIVVWAPLHQKHVTARCHRGPGGRTRCQFA